MPAHPNYPNGALPTTTLRTVQTGLYRGRSYAITLYAPVAAAWVAEKAALAQRGIVAAIAPPGGGYRDRWTQTDMRAQSLGWAHAYDWGLNPNSGAPLAPAGQSTHGWGTAVDVVPQAAVNALKAAGQALAHAFGFYFPLTNDPNHTDRLDLITAASGGSTPLEDDMTPEQANWLAAIYNAIFNGGGSMQDGGKSISQSIAELNRPVSRSAAAAATVLPADGKAIDVPLRQDNADTNTMVRKLLEQAPAAGGGLTFAQLDALAAKIAAKIPVPDLSALAASIAALDKQDDDYQAQILAQLQKGLTITGTAAPVK